MQTQNRKWGFYGAVRARGDIDPDVAWDVAMHYLADLGVDPECARDFLDSRYGRHIADQIRAPEYNMHDAAMAAVGSRRRMMQAIDSMRAEIA